MALPTNYAHIESLLVVSKACIRMGALYRGGGEWLQLQDFGGCSLTARARARSNPAALPIGEVQHDFFIYECA
jgi:hypothetical protein